jgi:hypothetical protein
MSDLPNNPIANDNDPRENWWSEWSMPILIFCGVAILFFGLTRLISKSGDYKSLVEELDSKTFGNKWVAAYELSRYVNSSHIPVEDIPWLAEQLARIYQSQQQDPRTRNFIIVTLSAIGSEQSLSLFSKALNDTDPQIQFSTLVALGKFADKFGKSPAFPWESIRNLMHQSNDKGVKQVAMIAVAQSRIIEEASYFENLLSNSELSGMERLHVALALAYYNNPKGISLIEDFWRLETRAELIKKWGLDANQFQQLQLNFLSAINKLREQNLVIHQYFIDLLIRLENLESDNLVKTKVQELLIMLKKP